LVPPQLQAAVKTTYRPGQEIFKNPSQSYLVAMRHAINAVAKLEGLKPLTGDPKIGEK
jgi:hypothetical protein